MLYVSEIFDEERGLTITSSNAGKISYDFILDVNNDSIRIKVTDSVSGSVKDYDMCAFRREFSNLLYSGYAVTLQSLQDFIECGCYDSNKFVFGACYLDGSSIFLRPQSDKDIPWAENIIKRIRNDLVCRKMVGLNTVVYSKPVTAGVVVLQHIRENSAGVLDIPKYVNCLGTFFAHEFCGVEELEIPDYIKILAPNCFSSFPRLRTVCFKGDIVYMGASLFTNWGSNSLECVKLPNKVTFMHEESLCSLDTTANSDLIVPSSLYKDNKEYFDSIECFWKNLKVEY